jgi:hypothetical protein
MRQSHIFASGRVAFEAGSIELLLRFAAGRGEVGHRPPLAAREGPPEGPQGAA